MTNKEEKIKSMIKSRIADIDELGSNFVRYKAKSIKKLLEKILGYIENKEQECKNLKEELICCRRSIKGISIKSTEICKSLEKDKQALKEIENYVLDNSDFDKSDKLTSNTDAYDILDIINKVKRRVNNA